jgi:acetyl-CoA synthetase
MELSSLKEFIAARDFLLKAHDYREAKEGFVWPKLADFNWARDYFDTLADHCTNPALVYVDDMGAEEKVSFPTLKDRSNKAANFLRDLGLVKGDRVMLMVPNSVELFEILLGAMKLGCAIIPASTLLTADDIRDRIARGRVKCIVTDGELASRVDQAAVRLADSVFNVSLGAGPRNWIDYSEIDGQSANFRSEEIFSEDDELLIYFTSGTTAKPKLVLQTHRTYPVGHLTTMYWIGVKGGELHYNVSAPGWAKYAYSSIFGVWNAEATSFVYNYTGRFNARQVLEVIEKYQVNTFCAPPTVWRFLLLEDFRKYHFSLKEMVSAGEPVNPEIIQRVKDATGLTLREGFGQTETTLQIGVFPGMEPRLGSMGVEAPGFHISILDGDYSPVPPKTDGVVAILVKPERPAGVMAGYIDPREKNREVFVGDWYLTGDVASQDEEGYFWFVGRADDVFKSSDYRISAFELESEIMAHPAVTEVGVIASPDSLRGFVPKAYVTLKPGVAPSKELAYNIFKFTRERVAPYKRPRIIQFTEELPKTVSGKIKRTDLRKTETDLRSKNARSKDEYFENDFQAELKTQRK